MIPMGPMISALEKAEIFHGHMVTFKVPMARRANELRQVMHPGRLRRVPATAGLSGLWAGSGNLDGASKEHNTSVTSVIIWNSPIGYIGIIWDYMDGYVGIWLVVEPPLWKMMDFVSWDYDIPNIWKNNEK